MSACAQGTSTGPAVEFCFSSGTMMVLGVLILIFGLFCMAVGAGMRKK